MVAQIFAIALIVAALAIVVVLGCQAQQEATRRGAAKRAQQAFAEQRFVEALEAGDFHEAERQLRHRFSLETKGASANRFNAGGQVPPERRYGPYGRYRPLPPWLL